MNFKDWLRTSSILYIGCQQQLKFRPAGWSEIVQKRTCDEYLYTNLFWYYRTHIKMSRHFFGKLPCVSFIRHLRHHTSAATSVDMLRSTDIIVSLF